MVAVQTLRQQPQTGLVVAAVALAVPGKQPPL
jgi:hypothetical protein